MSLADMINARPIEPPANSPSVRLVTHRVGAERNHMIPPRSVIHPSPTDHPGIRVSEELLNKARRLLEAGPLTLCYLAAHTGMSRTHAQRALAELLADKEIVELQIHGVRAFVYFLKEDLS